MKINVKIPKLGLTIESGKLTEWSKNIGDEVAVGDVLGIIEADKAVYDLEAPVAGRIVEFLVEPDVEIDLAIGTNVAVIDTLGLPK